MGKVYNNDNSACIYFTELTIKPTIHIPLMKAGERANLICNANRLCSGTPTVLWKWADGTIAGNMDDDYYKHVERYRPRGQVLKVYPTAHDHNKKITCVAEYGYSVVERTVTLTVKCKFAAVFVKLGVIWYISHHCLFFFQFHQNSSIVPNAKLKGSCWSVCASAGGILPHRSPGRGPLLQITQSAALAASKQWTAPSQCLQLTPTTPPSNASATMSWAGLRLKFHCKTTQRAVSSQ